MIELHERLSEFSYGYGVTREVEALLARGGVKVAPFLPSLVHEATLGFDVAFQKPGAVLMLQFKLGQSLTRFVPGPRPLLDKVFWRFNIETGEVGGQFATLLDAELNGADAFYVAPRLIDWNGYMGAFEKDAVLASSVIIRPSSIRAALDAISAPDGPHRIVYDSQRAYACSTPSLIKTVTAQALAVGVEQELAQREASLETIVDTLLGRIQVMSGLRRDRASDTRVAGAQRAAKAIETHYLELADADGQRIFISPTTVEERLEYLRRRARTDVDARAAALAVEVWTRGAQAVFVSRE
jgi:hypothetical protein